MIVGVRRSGRRLATKSWFGDGAPAGYDSRVAPSVRSCMASIAPSKNLLAGLLQALGGPAPLVILPHDNPDPDSLASAAALKYLAQELLEKDAVIAQGGIVGRAENRAMLTHLNIDLKPVSDLRLRPDSLVALVDTQPGRINNSLPRDIIPAVVIDHHP